MLAIFTAGIKSQKIRRPASWLPSDRPNLNRSVGCTSKTGQLSDWLVGPKKIILKFEFSNFCSIAFLVNPVRGITTDLTWPKLIN